MTNNLTNHIKYKLISTWSLLFCFWTHFAVSSSESESASPRTAASLLSIKKIKLKIKNEKL